MTSPSFFFDYELPEELIAQHPPAERDASRLLVVNRASGEITHHQFRELPELLRAGDRLVLNDTRVVPARLMGIREKTGGKWEALFLEEQADGAWLMLAQTRGFVQPGETCLTQSGLRLRLIDRTDERHWRMRPEVTGSATELLLQHGMVPLPPYIRKGQSSDADRDRYQTVYADPGKAGSVAAPTAGLHFTQGLLDRLQSQGILVSRVTLHVGLGTFAPVKVDDPTKHAIHAEWCEVSQKTVDEITESRSRGGRIIAIGTTTTRTLEAAARNGGLKPYRGPTDLYIHPPFEFQVLDGLITNFHLPRTTLLLLVQSLSGSELLRRAYELAIQERYRFFSYGDAMLVL